MARAGGRALLVASGGVALPFAMGWAIAALWGEPHLESIFTGAAMAATSVGITAGVLASRGLLETSAARLILAAAVIDDMLGLVVRAFVSGLARSSVHYLDLALTAVLAAGFTVLVARFGSRTAKRVLPHINARLRLVESEFALAMTLLFGLSARRVRRRGRCHRRVPRRHGALGNRRSARQQVTDGVAELMVPFFLAGIGLEFDVSARTTLSNLALSFAILAAGALALGRAEAFRAGAGMIPRGEVGIVVAQIGLRMGVMPPRVYAIVVFMSAAATLIAPPLLKLAFRNAPAPAPARYNSCT